MRAAENTDITSMPENGNLQEISDKFLTEARRDIFKKEMISVPVAALSMLGTGASSLVPAFRTVTQTTSVSATGLYKIANASVGDVLKVAKNGNFWGALKTSNGASKLVQLQAADPLKVTKSTVISVNPAMILMAAALYSMEQRLSDIKEIGQQIVSFLEAEKESEIEADVETLMSIVEKYKHNWDNEHYLSSNHKLVLDIQRTARTNMNFCQKKVRELLRSKTLVVSGAQVNAMCKDLLKRFQYYRLSLFAFALASFAEIILGGDFKEENIASAREEIEQLSMTYRDLFGQCSARLEKLSGSLIESNVLKGVGAASDALGKLIGNIPVVKNGPVDELLQSGGDKLKNGAAGIETKAVEVFASISNPGTGIFAEKMNDMIQIYDKTEDIYFDEKRIYLLSA